MYGLGLAQFFPADATGWVGLIGQTLTITVVVGGALWALIRRELTTAIATVDERSRENEKRIEREIEASTKSREEYTRTRFDTDALGKHIARLEGMLERLAHTVESQSRQMTDLLVHIARIEEKIAVSERKRRGET